MNHIFRMRLLMMAFVLLFFVAIAIVFAGRGFDPEYEANRQFRTALNGEIFTGDEEKDQTEIERIMELPRYCKAFPTGELAKSNWIYVDGSLEYAVEFNWIDSFTVKGDVIFDRTPKKKEK